MKIVSKMTGVVSRGTLAICLELCGTTLVAHVYAVRSSEAANRPHREVTTKRVTSFTRSDVSDSPSGTADNHMDSKMTYGQLSSCVAVAYPSDAHCCHMGTAIIKQTALSRHF